MSSAPSPASLAELPPDIEDALDVLLTAHTQVLIGTNKSFTAAVAQRDKAFATLRARIATQLAHAVLHPPAQDTREGEDG